MIAWINKYVVMTLIRVSKKCIIIVTKYQILWFNISSAILRYSTIKDNIKSELARYTNINNIVILKRPLHCTRIILPLYYIMNNIVTSRLRPNNLPIHYNNLSQYNIYARTPMQYNGPKVRVAGTHNL